MTLVTVKLEGTQEETMPKNGNVRPGYSSDVTSGPSHGPEMNVL